MNLQPGWILVAVGLVLVIGGLLWLFAPGVPIGRLPGDIRYESGNTRVYFPIMTCLVASAVLSLIVWIVRWFAR